MEKIFDVIIIGGGVAGMMIACQIENKDVLLIERNEKLGKKMFITGKGRCNVTNFCDKDEFFKNIISNSKFMFSSFSSFSNYDTYSFFEELGVPLKIERGDRVFPQSDKSSDLINALERKIKSKGVKVNLLERVSAIISENNLFTIKTDKSKYQAKAVVVCTGGVSYKSTGSTGDGYTFAKVLGHDVVSPKPALVPINLKEDVSSLAGLSLKNVEVYFEKNGQKSPRLFGEMLFTHKGVSGPIVLSLSSYINKFDVENGDFYIDLKPAINEEILTSRIEKDIKGNKKQLKTLLVDYLPKNLIDIFLKYCKIKKCIPVNQLNTHDIKELVNCFKHFKFTIKGFEDINAAIITSGGVSVSQINPKTMMSKLVNNLYFAGEVLDIDALTGGFNIQLALSTAVAVAKDINLTK